MLARHADSFDVCGKTRLINVKSRSAATPLRRGPARKHYIIIVLFFFFSRRKATIVERRQVLRRRRDHVSGLLPGATDLQRAEVSRRPQTLPHDSQGGPPPGAPSGLHCGSPQQPARLSARGDQVASKADHPFPLLMSFRRGKEVVRRVVSQ